MQLHIAFLNRAARPVAECCLMQVPGHAHLIAGSSKGLFKPWRISKLCEQKPVLECVELLSSFGIYCEMLFASSYAPQYIVNRMMMPIDMSATQPATGCQLAELLHDLLQGRSALLGMNAWERHKHFVANYVKYYGGNDGQCIHKCVLQNLVAAYVNYKHAPLVIIRLSGQPPADTNQTVKTDWDVLRESYRCPPPPPPPHTHTHAHIHTHYIAFRSHRNKKATCHLMTDCCSTTAVSPSVNTVNDLHALAL